MLFITNYALEEKKDWTPTKKQLERTIHFHKKDRDPSASVYFCRRDKKDAYREIGNKAFFEKMKGELDQEILLYIHGFNNQPEEQIFPQAVALQKLFDDALKGNKKSLQVIPLLWPCDADFGLIKDYWDDQDSSDKSAFGFSRMLAKFMAWRESDMGKDACFRPINLLAHSMGNRVLRLTLHRWSTYRGTLPALFRNIFLVAADIANESLEVGKSGYPITQSARNVSVYYANDDLSMTASKIGNIKNKVFSRRLGHTGPENMANVSDNVFAIDCDEVNNAYDPPVGHTYFLRTKKLKGRPGKVFKHMLHAIRTGRVKVSDPVTRRHTL